MKTGILKRDILILKPNQGNYVIINEPGQATETIKAGTTVNIYDQDGEYLIIGGSFNGHVITDMRIHKDYIEY